MAGNRLVVVTDELHTEASPTGLQTVQSGCDHEVVSSSLGEGHSEESLVLKCRELVAVAGILEHGVVGTTVVGRFGITDVHIAHGSPAHETVGIFKAAVLHHLGIEASVGTKIDVFEEDAIHGALDGSHRTGVDTELTSLGGQSLLSECDQ